VQIQPHRVAGRGIGAHELGVVGVGHQPVVVVATRPPGGRARPALVRQLEVLICRRQLRARAGLLVRRRHVVVRIGRVRAVVEVEQRKRVEIRDDRLRRPVLVEDREEGELSAGVACECPGQEPGVGLKVRMIGLRGGKVELWIAGNQLERIPTPVITHGGHSRILFCYVYINSNFSGQAVTP
jgi:hypothetical protein